MARKGDRVFDRLTGGLMGGLTGGLSQRRALARWRRLAERAPGLSLAELRSLRGHGRQIRRQIDRLLHVAEGRLALPLIGADALRRPSGADWVWRPELWCGPVSPGGIAAADTRARLGEEVSVFHDCVVSELTLRQVRNTRPSDLAPFGLRMDVFRFDGSFLSLVIDLPPAAIDGLKQRHLIRLDCVTELEKPIEILARLNVRHGPNTEKVVRDLPQPQGESMVEFDLAYTALNERRVERAWIDLIFEGPQMNQIVLRDVTLSRRLRAEV